MSTRHRIVTLVLLSSSTTALARPHHHRPPAPAEASPVLREVRTELAEFIDPKALPRFQALSDADGYPYVGNVRTKGSSREDDEMDDVAREPPSSRLTTGFIARIFHVNGRGERIDL
ncbi:MAG TPA: hypothetical protein VF403_26130 [Kofleriaceae bacterium]